MNRLLGLTPSPVRRKLPQETPIQGSWLVLLRNAWGAVMVLTVIYFVVNLPGAFTSLQIVCMKSVCPLLTLTPTSVMELKASGLSISFFATYITIVGIISAIVWLTIGGFIFWHKSSDYFALLVATALVTFGLVTTSIGSPDTLSTHSPIWWLIFTFLTFLGEISIFLFFYLFPDGHFVPRWTSGPVFVLVVVFGCLFFFPDLSISKWLIPLSLVWLTPFLALGVFVQFYRYRRVSNPVQQQQTRWVVLGLIVATVGYEGTRILLAALVHPHILLVMALITLIYLFLMLVPLSIGIAVLRDRLWEITILVNHTLVYGALTASVVGIYILVVGTLGVLMRVSDNLFISLLATGLVAVLFQPLRNRLQHAVNHLVYGERNDPYKVISHLGQRLEATLAPDAVPSTIVETVAQAFKLPYVAITLKQDGQFILVASYGGVRDKVLLRLPLVYQSEQIGELLLVPRAPGEAFTPANRLLLNDLARQAGIAIHTVLLTADLKRLTSELQHSRTRLVTAREEERRRLRRDLHDGLGSALTSVTFKLDAACNLLDRDPATVRTLLSELKTQTQASIADIRRLVYNLRPPILDEWGLVTALREYTTQHQINNMQIILNAPESFPTLPAAVEVAAYRIALEALANVIRHAQATICKICLDVINETLTLEVQDNGVGLPPAYQSGVGLTAMRERAAELGGSCTVDSSSTTGTHVLVRLPIVKEE